MPKVTYLLSNGSKSEHMYVDPKFSSFHCIMLPQSFFNFYLVKEKKKYSNSNLYNWRIMLSGLIMLCCSTYWNGFSNMNSWMNRNEQILLIKQKINPVKMVVGIRGSYNLLEISNRFLIFQQRLLRGMKSGMGRGGEGLLFSSA